MKLMTKEEMRKIDQKAIETYKVPSILLMEHAAYSVFQYLQQKGDVSEPIVIVCGAGNNAGDGFSLATILTRFSSAKVTVICMKDAKSLSKEAALYFEMCKALEIKILYYDTHKERVKTLFKEEESIIIDALFGTGLSRPITGQYKEVIEGINQSSAKVVSIDIPSGIDANTGKVLGIAVQADVTITFEFGKIGLYVYPGSSYASHIHYAKIGIPKQIIQEANTTIHLLENQEMKRVLPIRPERSNKGSYGKALIVGGQEGMAGSVTLTAISCLKAGAGLVTVATPKSIYPIISQKMTEVITVSLEDEQGQISLNARGQLIEKVKQHKVVAIGPGMGRASSHVELLREVLKEDKPCIIDADGLYAFKSLLKQLDNRKAPIIITPHPGEMAQLVNTTIQDILEEPMKHARDFAMTYKVTTVLKIEKTIIASPKGEVFINSTGNSGLAKAGSGDVLTGIITSFMAQGLKSEEAACLGVYLHGLTADYLKDTKSIYTIMPSDIILHLDQGFKMLSQS